MSRAGAVEAQGRLSLRSERGKLNAVQFFAVLFLAVFPTMAMLLPGDLVRLGGRYAWWTLLVAAVPAALGAGAAGALGARLGSLASAAREGLGPVAGRALLLVAWLAVGAYLVVAARESGDISAVTLVGTPVPVWMLTVLSMVPSALLVWLGAVALGRIAAFIGPVLVFTYLVVLGVSVPSVHLVWALPLLPRNGRFAAWHPLLLAWVWEAEPLFLGAGLMEQVSADGRRRGGRIMALVVGSSALLTAAGTWTMVAEAGPHAVAGATLPVLSLVNRITFGSTVQHLQSALLPIETMGVIIKVSVFLWLWCAWGRGVVGLPARTVLLLEAAVGTALALTAFSNLLAVDRALYTWLARWALPVLVAATFAAYGAFVVRRRWGGS